MQETSIQKRSKQIMPVYALNFTYIYMYLSGVLLFGSGVFDLDERTFECMLRLSFPVAVLFPSALLIASRILLRIRGSFNFFSSIIIPFVGSLLTTELDETPEIPPPAKAPRS